MKFLIDAQLPTVLQRVMNREGYEVVHAKDLGLADLNITLLEGFERNTDDSSK